MTTVLAPAAAPMDYPRYGRIPDCLTVEVKGSDIRAGVQCDSRACPIAQAIGHALWTLGVRYVSLSVTRSDVIIVQRWGEPEVEYAHDAGRWVSRFDAGLAVAPFVLTLTRVRRAAA